MSTSDSPPDSPAPPSRARPPRAPRRKRTPKALHEVFDEVVHKILGTGIRRVTMRYDPGSNVYFLLGAHCVGKTYLREKVAAELRARGYRVVEISENVEKIEKIVTSPADPNDPNHTIAMTRMLSARETDHDADFVIVDRGHYDSVTYTLTLQSACEASLSQKNESTMRKEVVDLFEKIEGAGIPIVSPNLVYCHVSTDDELRECYNLIGHRGREWELDWPFPQYRLLSDYMHIYFDVLSTYE